MQDEGAFEGERRGGQSGVHANSRKRINANWP
jgi:hypothetical protein